jgi:hypothetical protein
LYWRIAEPHDWPDAPELIVQVPEQESTRPPNGLAPRPDAGPIAVLSPPWGYGELLSSLVADGIGFGNIDFRYFGMPQDRPDRVAFVQKEIDDVAPGFVVAIPPLMQLEGLDIGSGQLTDTVVILIRYGQLIRARAAEVFRSRLANFGGEAGITAIEERNLHAVRSLAPGSRYLEVILADEDVTVAGREDRHRLCDTVAWLALDVTCLVLESWRIPPIPVAGPLRSLLLPSGRVRRAPAMASHAAWRTIGDHSA